MDASKRNGSGLFAPAILVALLPLRSRIDLFESLPRWYRSTDGKITMIGQVAHDSERRVRVRSYVCKDAIIQFLSPQQRFGIKPFKRACRKFAARKNQLSNPVI